MAVQATGSRPITPTNWDDFVPEKPPEATPLDKAAQETNFDETDDVPGLVESSQTEDGEVDPSGIQTIRLNDAAPDSLSGVNSDEEETASAPVAEPMSRSLSQGAPSGAAAVSENPFPQRIASQVVPASSSDISPVNKV